LDKKKQDLYKEIPMGATFIPTEMGSAHSVSADSEGSAYKYEKGPTELKQGTKGPPWGIEPSMKFVCDEVGIDYDQFVKSIETNKTNMEIAQEFAVKEKTIRLLKERFYSVEAINGNYGQD
jgi:hypothetical protein